MAYCSDEENIIGIVDLQTKENYAAFRGVKISDRTRNNTRKVTKNFSNSYDLESWTHVKEIPNTKLFCSLYHLRDYASVLRIYSYSQKGKVKQVFTTEE